MWKFLVKNQSIEILEREVLADHQIQYVQFKFTFDGDWKRFHKVVQFSQCDETSIVENTSLMGIPYPDAIKKAIDVLQKKAGRINDEAEDVLEEMEDDDD